MKNLLEHKTTYKKLSQNPTNKIDNKINKVLKKYEEKNYLTRDQRLKLSPQNSIPPQIYGLPKIHKENVPLRPIVSAIGSPTHNLAKFIVIIISSISGNTKLYVKKLYTFG